MREYYVPGLGEKDPDKIIRSLMQAHENSASDADDIATRIVGPASATDNALARFDAATGKLIQNSDITLGDTDGKLTRAAGISLSGTNTNDNAASGYVGEHVEYSLTATALTSAAATVNLANGAFGAGDWDIWGYVFVTGGGATSLTNYTFSVSSTSATHDTSVIDRFDQLRFAGGWADPFISKTIGPHRRSLSGSTTLYLTASATFASVLSVTSKIRGRRVR